MPIRNKPTKPSVEETKVDDTQKAPETRLAPAVANSRARLAVLLAAALAVAGCPPKYKDFEMTEDAGTDVELIAKPANLDAGNSAAINKPGADGGISNAPSITLPGNEVSVSSGLIYTNTSPEQKELAAQILKLEKDAIIVPATGYAFCPRGRTILNEPLVQFNMNGYTLTLIKSIAERVQKANEYCIKNKGVRIKIISTTRSNVTATQSSGKRKGWLKRTFGSAAASGNCNTFHLAGIPFDVLNFKDSHECLVRFDFYGGWAGVKNDPFHYTDRKLDIIPVLTGRKAALRTLRNKAWCKINRACRKNNR